MISNVSAAYEHGASEAVVECAACGSVRIPAKLLNDRWPGESAMLVHKMGVESLGILACVAPGELRAESGQHDIFIAMRHANCSLKLQHVDIHVHGPVDSETGDCTQRIRCGDDEFDVIVKRVERL